MRNWAVLKTLPSGIVLYSILIGPTCHSRSLTNGTHGGRLQLDVGRSCKRFLTNRLEERRDLLGEGWSGDTRWLPPMKSKIQC